MTSGTQAASAAQLVDEARRAAAAGSNDRAIALLQSALDSAPDDPTILNMLANRLLAEGDADAARAHLQRAIAGDPAAPALWLNLAAAERQRDDAAGEEEALDRALAIEPYLLPALLQKGELYERQERSADCLRA